ncbi:MAG: HigA family addiction module antitoxin [Gammaproteobacteria bacterium]|nr:HigA family addiction module antitoxin [Gammaproteobacteria bacterium]
MLTATNQYTPDYAVSPGEILNERIVAEGISQAELARRCGHSAKLISEIINGKAPLNPRLALELEKVLNVDASIWLNVETDYRLYMARKAEERGAADAAAWLKQFPVKELVRRGAFDKPQADADTMSKLLSFFGVASIKAWSLKYELANVVYRHSQSFKSDKTALATWLRLGELEAEGQECADYNEARFKRSLKEIRRQTRSPIEEALMQAIHLCNEAGVALTLVKPLPETALSGAAWWLSPKKAVIQLSARHKTDDHLWFSLFHEAAHLLLHSKKTIFTDSRNGGSTEIEVEADNWASNKLIPRSNWNRFIATSLFSKTAIQSFAEEQGIAPGIVVGALQHEGYIPWSHMNGLKARLEWKQ